MTKTLMEPTRRLWSPRPRSTFLATRSATRWMWLARLGMWSLAGLGAGCGPHLGADLPARMSVARSALEGFGFAPTGPLLSGTIEGGKDTRLPLDIKEGCVRILALTSERVSGLSLTVLDATGREVARGGQHEGASTVELCVSDPGTYALVARSQAGSGPLLAQIYRQPGNAGNEHATESTRGECTGDNCEEGTSSGAAEDCSSGMTLTVPGTTKGSTLGKQGSPHWSCAAADGPGAVYRLHVDGRHHLVLDVTAKFDVVVALFRASPNENFLCDSQYELECSDDYEAKVGRAHLEANLDEGDYGVVVGGFDADRGDFELSTRLEDAPNLQAVCATARPIAVGANTVDVLGGRPSNFRASCSTTDGDEVLHALELRARSRVRLTGQGSLGDLTLSLRSRCEDAASEVACTSRWQFGGVTWSGVLSAGSYTLLADTSEPQRSGNVELRVDTAPDVGQREDDCKHAQPWVFTPAATSLDTFQSKGDVRVACAADAAADLVYRLEVPTRSRLLVSSTEDEGRHVVAIQRSCGEPKSELACELVSSSKPVEAMLEPGAYHMVVKGQGPEDFGRVSLSARLVELHTVEIACRNAPALTSGGTVNGDTRNAGDHYASIECGGAFAKQHAGDRVHRFTLRERSKVQLVLKNAFSGAYLALRSDCNDPLRGQLGCSSTYARTLERDLDVGTYYVVVDGQGSSEGTYALEYTARPIK